MQAPVILNDKGQPIVLNQAEQHHCQYMARQMFDRFGTTRGFRNSLGYEVQITTLTTISKKISEQKFFEIAPADYLPMRVGEGTWSSNLLTYRSFEMADIFESGIINLGGQNDRLAAADAGVDALSIKIFNWAKSIGWSIFELEEASKSGNWDLISAKEKSRKKNWDLGIQKVAFLGAAGQNAASGSCLGLLNQAGITFNTTLVTKAINTMSPTELSTFQQNVIAAYRVNCNYTAFPTHFIIPESDYNGLVAQASPTFPMKSMIQLLEEGFQVITRNKNFKILPLAYADVANSGGVLTKQTYTLLNYDEESIRMDIPLDYTNTLANSINNFQFQSVGYGQFTGVLAYRPLEMLQMGY
jgi:hypothetical protein